MTLDEFINTINQRKTFLPRSQMTIEIDQILGTDSRRPADYMTTSYPLSPNTAGSTCFGLYVEAHRGLPRSVREALCTFWITYSPRLTSWSVALYRIDRPNSIICLSDDTVSSYVRDLTPKDLAELWAISVFIARTRLSYAGICLSDADIAGTRPLIDLDAVR